MTKLRLILSQLRTVIEPPLFCRRQRVRYQPGAEPLETRALQSGFKAVPALTESLRPATPVHVVPVKIVSALNVIYHTGHVDILSRAPASETIGIAAPSGGSMAAADDTTDDQDDSQPPPDDDDDDDGDVDGNNPTGS